MYMKGVEVESGLTYYVNLNVIAALAENPDLSKTVAILPNGDFINLKGGLMEQEFIADLKKEVGFREYDL